MKSGYVPWAIKSKAKLIDNKKKVSTDRASMILRKYELSVSQSLCLIYNIFLIFFISLYAIYIHWKCAKLKKTKAEKLYKFTALVGWIYTSMPSNKNKNMDCLHRGAMPL